MSQWSNDFQIWITLIGSSKLYHFYERAFLSKDTTGSTLTTSTDNNKLLLYEIPAIFISNNKEEQFKLMEIWNASDHKITTL